MVTLVGTVYIFDPSSLESFARPKTMVLAAGVTAVVCVAIGERLLRIGLPTVGRRTFSNARGFVVGIAVALVVSYVAATVVSIDRSHSWWGESLQYQGLVPLLLSITSAGLALRWTRKERDVRQFMTIAATTSVPMSVYAFAQVTYHDPWWDVLPSDRAFATIGQSNSLGAVLVLAVFCGCGAAASTGGRGRAGLWIVTTVIALAVGTTLSRGAFIGLASGGVVWSSLRVRPAASWRKRAAVVTILGGSVAVPGVRAATAAALHRASSLAAGRADPSIRPHLGLLRAARAIVADHPWTGIGPDNYVLVFDRYRDAVLPPEESWVLSLFRPESPHNVVVARAVDGGIPALTAYLALFVVAGLVTIRAARRATGNRRNLLAAGMAAITAHFVTDLFMTGETAGTLLGWVVLGTTVAVATSDPGHAANQDYAGPGLRAMSGAH